jgi:hypothetical protein
VDEAFYSLTLKMKTQIPEINEFLSWQILDDPDDDDVTLQNKRKILKRNS